MSTQGDLFSQSMRPVVSKRELMLVDASGFIFRAFHALPPLTTARGLPTNAVLGFTRMIMKLLRERGPSHCALCFDKDSRRGRLAIDPTYKANRVAPPKELAEQFELIRRVAHALRLPILEVPGWEADDVIATVVSWSRTEEIDVEIVSSDKDLLQILRKGVAIFDPVKDTEVGEEEAFAKYGVHPHQMRDYQALVGDAVDNVPKVPGIGPKTAVDLLRQFGTVDELLARVSEVAKPKVREALLANADQLRRAQQLVTMKDDLELSVTLASLERQPLDVEAARALFQEFEFTRLLKELPGTAAAEKLAEQSVRIESLVDLEAFLSTTGETLIVVPILGAGLAEKPPALPCQIPDPGVLGLMLQVPGARAGRLEFQTIAEEGCRARLTASLEPETMAIATYDGKALWHALAALGIELGRPIHDISLIASMLDSAALLPELSAMVERRLNVDSAQIQRLWPVTHDAQVEPTVLAAATADAVEKLLNGLRREAMDQRQLPVLLELEFPLVPVLGRMERRGIRLDREALAGVSAQVDAACLAISGEIFNLAGREFNIASPAQLAQILYDDLRLPVLKKNKSGPSTDHEVLEKLAEQHALPRAIIEYRNVAKLKSTYLDTLPKLVAPDGRIHTTLRQGTTATGRLSSVDPNLQNIPVRTELGRQIRKAFVADDGFQLISADYSQIELRILAHISSDEALLRAFAEAADIHARTAAEVFGIEEARVSPDQRRIAKMVNYGIAYGLSAHGLSARLNIPLESAQGFIDRYFARFSGIARYIEETIAKAKRDGFVECLSGRRRSFPELKGAHRGKIMAAERAAVNMPIQGTAADIVKRAMISLDREIASSALQGRMLLQVHDELLLEVPDAEVAAMTELVRRTMSSAAALKVELVVDVGVGRSWAEAH
jgi:DNA polymerase-1